MKYNDKDWDAGLDPMARIAVAEGLSPGAGAVLRVLRWLPLASADDMAMVVGRKVPGVLADLRKLARAGLVESAQLGCTRAQRQRWYLSAGCLDRAGLSDATWHDEAARCRLPAAGCRLLELLPSVEQFYIVVGAVNTLGAFLEFQWLDSLGDEGPSCDAAARYELGWIALFWCGPLVAETHLAERLTRFPLDCQTLAVGAAQPWPRQMYLVAADEWGRELGIRALEDFGLEKRASVWCVNDGAPTGFADADPGRGWIYQPLKKRGLGRGAWEGVLANSPWSGAGGLMSRRILDSVTQWPGVRLSFLKAVVREGKGEHRVQETCRELVASGLVLQHGEGRTARYFATTRGLNFLVTQDHVHHRDARPRTGLSQWPEANNAQPRRPVSKPHEDGLRSVLRPFVAKGCPVSNGPRWGEHLGASGGINPDAMLYLSESPFGEGWHYLEYERSIKGQAKVGHKLNGYSSDRRRDAFPVLLVCWDADAEIQFQKQGEKLQLQLVTTNLVKLRKHSPLGNDECWSMNGTGVRLG